MRGSRILYSAAELAWLEDRKHLPRKVLHAAFVYAFDRPDVTFDNIKALCTRRGWKSGRTGRFEKGSVPANKGRKGFCAPGSEKGWFKPGHRGGKAAQNYKPIGSERITADGYIERKIHDGMPLQSRWRAVHLIRWEEIHGPLPEGHALKCMDGNKANTDPENWFCIPRGMLPRLNSRWRGVKFDEAPPELKPTILAAARLAHAAHEARKGK